jgi:hypothetical protein
MTPEEKKKIENELNEFYESLKSGVIHTNQKAFLTFLFLTIDRILAEKCERIERLKKELGQTNDIDYILDEVLKIMKDVCKI